MRIVHCDREPAVIGDYQPVDVALVGDATTCLQSLRVAVKELRARIGAPPPQSPPPAVSIPPFFDVADDRSSDRGLDPRAVLDYFNGVLPARRVVVSDVGRWAPLLPIMLDVPEPRRLVTTLGFASIGHGLGAAVGAARACPGDLTVLFAGDGGLLMSVQELGMVQRANARLLIVVLNDGQYGAELPALADAGLGPDVARFPAPDLPALARAYGGDGLVVSTPAGLAALEMEFHALPTPFIVDARIDPAINSRDFLMASSSTD